MKNKSVFKKSVFTAFVMFIPLLLPLSILCGCAGKNEPEETAGNDRTIEFVSPAEPAGSPESHIEAPVEEKTISEEQALEAIKKYCRANNPDLEDMENSDEYTVYWDVSTNDAGEIVVLYRSYTGAQTRYYINPDSGETYVTELVPGIIDDESKTGEVFNIRE